MREKALFYGKQGVSAFLDGRNDMGMLKADVRKVLEDLNPNPACISRRINT